MAETASREGSRRLTLSGLNVYPVKSAAGVALERAPVDGRGLAGDRRWMVVDGSRRFLTQRTHPRMALVSVRLGANGLVLNAPGLPTLAVGTPHTGAAAVRVQVWDDVCGALTAGEEAAGWFSRLLGMRCELAYMNDGSHRSVEGSGGTAPFEVGFADAFPFLLISEASLEDLNRRLDRPLPMDRFRPNLVVRGCEPYAEDGWWRIRVGAIEFHVVKPCTRCTTTTVDQATGERGREPLATLATYRRVAGGVVFGQNLVHAGVGDLRIGDEVTVLESVEARGCLS